MSPRICLCMIVKDEAHVIERCLRSVLPYIDAWCIVDTGSTDGTQDVIRSTLRDVSGQLHERPWKDFGHNRTEAIRFAQHSADYLLLLDADEELQVPDGFQFSDLTASSYCLLLRLGSLSYWRTQLVSTSVPWRYEGVLHEYLTSDQPQPQAQLHGPVVVSHGDGGRSQGIVVAEKYRRDAVVLEKALLKEPDNRRYVFYLAQSYRDSDQIQKSLETYQRRAVMGGWEEEVWYSLLQVAMLSAQLNEAPATVIERYLAAYDFRPKRSEPLVYLAAYHRERKQYALAHLYAERAMATPKPEDILFLDESCYLWRAKDEYSIASYYVGRYEESKIACEELLNGPDLPAAERARVKENLEFAVRALSKGTAP